MDMDENITGEQLVEILKLKKYSLNFKYEPEFQSLKLFVDLVYERGWEKTKG